VVVEREEEYRIAGVKWRSRRGLARREERCIEEGRER